MIRDFQAGLEHWRFVELDEPFFGEDGRERATQIERSDHVVFIRPSLPAGRREIIQWRAIAEARQIVAAENHGGIPIISTDEQTPDSLA